MDRTIDIAFRKLEASLAEHIDDWFTGDAWNDDTPPCFVPDEIAVRMAEAAMAVLRACSDHERWAEREGHWKG